MLATMKEITYYKEILEAEKIKLETELQTIGRRNPSNPNDWEAVPQETGLEADESDTAEQIKGYEDNTAILMDLETRYNEVLTALGRIEERTYGTCSVSGEEIEEDRLEANPAADTCKAHLA